MGLFINKKQHPDVYKNRGALIEPNQVEYCINAFTDFVKEQKASNKSLNHAIEGLNNTNNEFQLQQNRQWRELEQRIFELKSLHKEHERIEKNVLSWLHKLEDKQDDLQRLIQKDRHDKKEVLAHIQQLAASQQEITRQIQDIGEAKESLNERLEFLHALKDEVINQLHLIHDSNEQILNKIDKQTNLQHKVAHKITAIEENQQEVINRVDGQEGMIDKFVHQIDQLRFILFERTSFLEEKIEKAYNQAITYFQKVKDSVKQPQSSDIGSREEEENTEA